MSSRYNYLPPHSYPYPYYPFRHSVYYSPNNDFTQQDPSFKKPRIAVELAASRFAREDLYNKLKLEAQFDVARTSRQNELKRSRNRLNVELAQSQLASQIALRDSLRRSRVENQVDSILRRY